MLSPLALCLLALLIIQTTPINAAHAESVQNISRLYNSVFLLKMNVGEGACGTAFALSPDTLVTNAHLAKTLCPHKKCHNLSLSGPVSDRNFTPRKLLGVRLEQRVVLSALDIALFTMSPPLKDVPTLQVANTSQALSAQVYSFGYPNCRTLVRSSGQIAAANALHLSSNLEGLHGSSGSPVFTLDGKLLGFADESLSFINALFSKLLGSKFLLRIIKASHLSEILIGNPLTYQAKTLLNYYFTEIPRTTGLTRLRKATEFRYLVREHLSDLQRKSDAVQTPSLLGELPEITLSKNLEKNQSSNTFALTALIFLANYEQFGTKDFEALHKLVFNSPRLGEQTKKRILQAMLENQPVTNAHVSTWILGGLFLSLIVLLLLIRKVRATRKTS